MPAGHQGSVSNQKTGYQLPVADYQLPVADYLSSFKGPHGASPGITCMACMKIFDSFFACFSILHFFTFLSQNTPERRSPNRQESYKSIKKHSPDLAWKSYLQKGSPKCENRIPFNVLSLFPRFPDTHKNITNWIPNGPRNCNL